MIRQPGIQYSDDGSWWWDGSQWRAAATDPPPGPATVAPAPAPEPVLVAPAEVEPSVIALTWPHRFLQQVPNPRHKYQAPCGGPFVDGREVSKLVLALPLARLWRYGIIGMNVETSKKLLGTATTVKVWPLQPAQVSGIEAQLMGAMQREQNVDGVVKGWIGADQNDPWGFVRGHAERAAVGGGVFVEVDAKRGALKAAFQGKTKIEPVCERVAVLESQANQLAQIWSEFASGQPAMYAGLLEKIGTGIGARQVKTDGNDSIKFSFD